MLVKNIIWRENGDHPHDNSILIPDEEIGDFLSEGKVVRRYRTPKFDGQEVCKKCKDIMHNHGWIEEYHCIKDQIICPGDEVPVIYLEKNEEIYIKKSVQKKDIEAILRQGLTELDITEKDIIDLVMMVKFIIKQRNDHIVKSIDVIDAGKIKIKFNIENKEQIENFKQKLKAITIVDIEYEEYSSVIVNNDPIMDVEEMGNSIWFEQNQSIFNIDFDKLGKNDKFFTIYF